MLKLLRGRLFKVPVTLLVAVCLLGALALPAPVQAENLARTVGGAAGAAAGFVGGAALAAAVTSAGALASMGPLAVTLIGAAITMGGGFLGAKALSHVGLAMDRALGPGSTWMLLGSVAGTLAAVALIPALGPFAGAGGMVIKGVVGGIAGGVLGKLFAPTLEAVATPRTIYAAMGALVGGLAGNIPGAIAGAAGGYALGAIFDDNFFADEDKYTSDYVDEARWRFENFTDRMRDWRHDIGDWVHDRTDGVRDWTQDRWYDEEDTYYYYQDGRWDRWSQGAWQHGYPYRDHGSWGHGPRGKGRNEADLEAYRQDYYQRMRQFQEANHSGSQRERYKALERLREAEALYRDAWESYR